MLGVRLRDIAVIYGQTIMRVRISLLTIAVMLALGYVTRYGGTTRRWASPLPRRVRCSILLADARLAGRGANGERHFIERALWQFAEGYSGATRYLADPHLRREQLWRGDGKMIDAQSIVVAQTAIGSAPGAPDAGTILRAVFWHSLVLAILVGVLVWLQARVWPWMIPGSGPRICTDETRFGPVLIAHP